MPEVTLPGKEAAALGTLCNIFFVGAGLWFLYLGINTLLDFCPRCKGE
ncbi:MAG: hypothetical protein AB1426_12820 [Bacillota bacterium]